jgi:hypothetical protein
MINQVAKDYWELAQRWLQHADEAQDINTTIAYTGQAECALNMAQFAVDNALLVAGIDENAPPVPVPEGMPSAPMQGPKFWGAPA